MVQRNKLKSFFKKKETQIKLTEKIARYKPIKHFWKAETKVELTEDDFNHNYFINRELRRVKNATDTI